MRACSPACVERTISVLSHMRVRACASKRDWQLFGDCITVTHMLVWVGVSVKEELSLFGVAERHGVHICVGGCECQRRKFVVVATWCCDIRCS
jgi:hypothetical protein